MTLKNPLQDPSFTPITVIGFDGDDTLWHHDSFFRAAVARFGELVMQFGAPVTALEAAEALDTQHILDLKLWGYGVKGLTLTMMATAIRLTAGRITGEQMQQLLDLGRETYTHPITLLPHVRETLTALRGRYLLILITKGDLVAQEMKLAQSGLHDLFDGIEIVSEKDPQTYARILKRYHARAAEFVMIGNALRSDILPPLSLGAQAIHVPYHVSWHFETAEIAETDRAQFIMLPHLGDVPHVIDTANAKKCTLAESV